MLEGGVALALLGVLAFVIWRSQQKDTPPIDPPVTRQPTEVPIVENPPPQEPEQSGPPAGWSLPPLVSKVEPETPPETTSTGETPAQSLIRLREKLAQGQFAALPVGTLTRDNCHYFYVSRSTQWQSASRMARAFGGNLAIVDDPETRQWLAAAVPPAPADDPTKLLTWIGATRISSDGWRWVSNIAWQPDSPVEGSGNFAAIDSQGAVRSRTSEDAHPFFIQWYRDGSKPTDIRRILTITGDSLATDQPIFPPGVEEFDGRRLLVIEEPHTYTEALELAELSGGKLMSASTSEEADWLETRVRTMNAPDGIWLGATMTDHFWSWNDSQAWDFARWSPDSNPGSGDYLLILPDAGWDSAIRNQRVSGLVIEWSQESPSKPGPTPAAALREFEERAKVLLGEFDAIRDKAARGNADTYLWQLDLWLRRRNNNSEISRWTPRVRSLKATVKGGRLPSDIPQRPTRSYPGELHELARHHLKKQLEFDREFLVKAKTIRDSYTERLELEVSKAQSIGQRESARFFSEKIEAASDIGTWTKRLGF